MLASTPHRCAWLQRLHRPGDRFSETVWRNHEALVIDPRTLTRGGRSSETRRSSWVVRTHGRPHIVVTWRHRSSTVAAPPRWLRSEARSRALVRRARRGAPARNAAPSSRARDERERATRLDYRMYVHDMRLLTADGREVPLELIEDGTWQHRGVALLDFEHGSGCDSGTEPTNASVHGMVRVRASVVASSRSATDVERRLPAAGARSKSS